MSEIAILICHCCKGRGTLGGSFYVYESCKHCNGSGRIERELKQDD